MGTPEYVKVDGATVRYFDTGAGKNLVFLHGFCESSDIFELLVPDLAKNYRVLSIDLPGHGGSDMVPGMHHIDEMARWLHRVMRVLKLKKFVLIGHSLGGYIGLAYAARYPQELAGLGLFHSSAGSDPDSRKEIRNKTIKLIEKHGKEPFLRSFIPKLFSKSQPEMIERVYQLSLQTRTDAMLALTAAMRDRIDSTPLLEQLDIPVLFIIGGQDEFISRSQARDELLKSKKGIGCFLQDAGHAGFYESPEKCLFAIRNFM